MFRVELVLFWDIQGIRLGIRYVYIYIYVPHIGSSKMPSAFGGSVKRWYPALRASQQIGLARRLESQKKGAQVPLW